MIAGTSITTTEEKINRRAIRVGTFEVFGAVCTCSITHVHYAGQLPFLANRNAELAVPPLFWPVNCIKIGAHVALLSGTTVYLLYSSALKLSRKKN